MRFLLRKGAYFELWDKYKKFSRLSLWKHIKDTHISIRRILPSDRNIPKLGLSWVLLFSEFVNELLIYSQMNVSLIVSLIEQLLKTTVSGIGPRPTTKNFFWLCHWILQAFLNVASKLCFHKATPLTLYPIYPRTPATVRQNMRIVVIGSLLFPITYEPSSLTIAMWLTMLPGGRDTFLCP